MTDTNEFASVPDGPKADDPQAESPRAESPQTESPQTESAVQPSPEDVLEGQLVPEKLTPEKVGEAALKFASETAYAAAGFANVIAEKAKEFVDKQKAQYSADHPDAAADPTKAFLDQLTTQVNRFVEDLGHTYKDLADRGREAVAKLNEGIPKVEAKDAPGPFDLDDAADESEPIEPVGGAYESVEPESVATEASEPFVSVEEENPNRT